MTLKETVLNYYLNQNYSCSEAVLRGCNDFYKLNLPDEVFISASCFTRGMYAGYTCGAFTSCLMVLSVMYSNGRAHESKNMQNAVMFFNRRFKEKTESAMCGDLRRMYFTPETRCQKTVEITCDIFEEYVKELKEKEENEKEIAY